jgi:hypothetical protein
MNTWSSSNEDKEKRRKGKMSSWKGEWNLEDIKEVQQHLRSLKLR